jgi:cytochrome bd-type quinol oxidase subunit 2
MMSTIKKSDKSFSSRKFASVGLFFTATTLVITGISLEILEELESGFLLHFCTAVHVLTGLAFAVFAILHTVSNWRSLKTHIKKAKGTAVSREATVAFAMGLVVVIIGVLVAFF